MLNASFFRSLARPMFLVWVALTAISSALFGQAPTAAAAFDPNVDGNVYAVAVQPDSKIVVVGQFTAFRANGTSIAATRNNIARLNFDGTVDAGFDPNANGPIRTVVLQQDGKILIGGDFTNLQPGGAGTPVARNRIARLNSDGTVDTTFDPNITGGLQPQVYAIAVQNDGSVVIGGGFKSNYVVKNSDGTSTTITRQNLARFSATGVVDAAYNPNPNGIVLALAMHNGGKVLVGGGFTTFQENGKAAATTSNRIARLNVDGTVDSDFNPNANNAVMTLAVQRDGKIILGGSFTTLQTPSDAGASTRLHIARLNLDGTIDTGFFPNTAGNVTNVAVAPDGAIFIGGPFSSAWGGGSTTSVRAYLARFLPDGSLDTAFSSGVNAEVAAIAFQSDGKLVVGGYFTRVQPTGTPAVLRNRLARLNPNGALDSNFELDNGGRPLTSITQSDGKIVLGGSFTLLGGATHHFLARMSADGTVDSSYNPDFNGRIYALAYDTTANRVLVGGEFTTAGGETRNYIARLNSSGTIDSDFNPNLNGPVGSIVVQPDGKILVGGRFSTAQPTGQADLTRRSNLLRLTTDGQLDTTFNPAPDSTVSSMLLQPDGKIVIAGEFTSLTPNENSLYSRSRMARLNADGSVDANFNPNFSGQVSALALQSDGKIVVGGQFTALAPPNVTTAVLRNRIVRLNSDGTADTAFNPNANGNVLTIAVQSDGKIVIGGTFTTLQPNGASDWTLRKYAARLNADGTVDSSFNLDLNEQLGNRVDSLRLQADGKILIGGSFTSLQPVGATTRVARKNFARVNADGSLDSSFNINAGGATAAQINAVALQLDGKVVTGGVFSDLGGARTTNIARFNVDGSADQNFGTTLTTDGAVNSIVVRPDSAPVATQLAGFAWLTHEGTLRPSFVASANAKLSGEIDAILVLPDGSVLVGGAFSNLTSATGGGLLKFKADGTLDPTFNPRVGGGVNVIGRQSDGRIIIGGSFNTVSDVGRNRLARLSADGTLDTDFDPEPNGIVMTLVVQPNDKILVGGQFTAFTPKGGTTSVTATYLARLNSDGSIDTNYSPMPSAEVDAIALQPDGKAVVGGSFTAFVPNAATTTTARSFIARVNDDGTLDPNFIPNTDGSVFAIALEPDGSMIIGGSFANVQPTLGGTVQTATARSNLARIRSDGAVDPAFSPILNSAVSRIVREPSGSLLISGAFTTVQPTGATQPISRNRLARLNVDGTLDALFNPDVVGTVFALVAAPDGSVLVGGNFTGIQANGVLVVGGAFTTIGGVPAKYLAMLNDDGSINTSFLPSPNGAVNALLALSDGRLVAGGAFTSIGSVARNRLARFTADGKLDPAFSPNVNGTVNVLGLQTDGKIVLGGSFLTVNGVVRANLARVNADGTVDATFNPTVGGTIVALVVQPDGRILVASNGASSGSVFRINSDGSTDNTFVAQNDPAKTFSALALQADGRVLAGGSFQGTAVPAVIGAPAARPQYLARFNVDGSVDGSFNPQPNGPVNALALQSDGHVIIGGNFTTVGGLQRVGLARLGSTSLAAETIGVTSDRKTVIWARSGPTGELSGVTFEYSTDLKTWTTLGIGTRIGVTASWQLTGQNFPATGSFFIRGRGITSGPSSGLYEIEREFNYAVPAGVPVGTATRFEVAGFVVNPTTGVLTALPPGAAGVYLGSTRASASIHGIDSAVKVVGQGSEVGSNITHPNGNVYDQLLLEGPAVTITADPGQVSRISFLDLNNDIVQVEFSGAGSLSLVLDANSGPMSATNYNQPDVLYMKGHAGIVIVGADETTNLSVFSVGKLTAVNQALFRDGVAYDGMADIGYVAITSANGKFGGLRTANANYFATSGLTGVYAPGVQFVGPVYVGDINGYDAAVAMLAVGTASEVKITGGNLLQPNGQSVTVSGIG